MNFTNETIRKGNSVIGDFRMDYVVTYIGENNVTNINAQIKKLNTDINGTKSEKYVGSVGMDMAADRFSFSIVDNKVVNADERAILYNEFEKSIKTIMG